LNEGVVVIDTSLLVLLVVGTASRNYIAKHKRLKAYTIEDFDLLGLILSDFSDIILLPHILAEVSNIARQIDFPARMKIQAVLRTLIETCAEFPAQSVSGAQREEFDELGLTDSVILHFCTMYMNGIIPTLLTVDTNLANAAHSLGYSVIDYKKEFLSE
jgi:hypothetical protein